MNSQDYVSPRKRQAMGGDPLKPDNFGVDHLDSHAAGGPTKASPKGYLKDSERGARPPINSNQANPDHGNME